MPSYVNDKLLVPFDEDMFDGKHRLSTSDFNDIYPEFLKNTKYDNKYYSIPFSKSVQILYYNKHLLNKYHLSVPHDWHDFQKMRHKLPHNVVLVSCNKSLAPEYTALSKAAGTYPVNAALKANITDQASYEAANTLATLAKQKAITLPKGNYGDQLFKDGKAVFYIGSSTVIANMRGAHFKWSTAPLPMFHNHQATTIGGNNIVMFNSATPQQRQGAWAFISYLISERGNLQWTQATGYLPIRKSVAASKPYHNFLQQYPYYQAGITSLQFASQTPAFNGYETFYQLEKQMLQKIVTKHVDIRQQLQILQNKTINILKKNNSQ